MQIPVGAKLRGPEVAWDQPGVFPGPASRRLGLALAKVPAPHGARA